MVDGALDDQIVDAGQQPRHLEVRIVKRLHGHAEQGRLHGTGRDFERLQKKSANAHGDDNGHEKNLDVLAPLGVWVGLEPFVGGLLQFVGPSGEGFIIGVGVQRGPGLLQSLVNGPQGRGGERVALGVAQLAHMPAQVARPPLPGRKEPS